MARKGVRAMANTNVPPIPPLTFPNDLPLFRFWLQRMLPTAYTDAMSYSELLDKVIAYLNSVIEDQNDVNADLKALYEYVEQLYQWMKTFEEHGFDDYYKEQVAEWIAKNLKWIFQNLVAQVFFGLNTEGYFVAYIPESWSDIVFDTGAVYGTEEYGRLILLMNVNGVDWDDSTGNGNLPYLSDLESRVENLERNVGINNKTLYTELAPDGRISLPPTGKRIENPLG